MSRAWQKQEWFNEQEQEAAKCFFGVGNPKVLDDGVVRFDLTIYTDIGDLVLKGFRFDPSKEIKLKPPCYRVGGGWQALAVLKGPVKDMVLEMIEELVSSEAVEQVQQ